MTTMLDSVVIGAGQAGLAAGYQLQRAGLSFRILEASAEAGGSWPHYYKSLRLFSPARFSSLPGLPFPGAGDRHPARDEVVAYLRSYAQRFHLPIETNTRVARVERDATGFMVEAEDGRQYQARSLIAATGSFHRPFLPNIPEQERYRGHALHSFAYHDPTPFAGQRVVVVGGGNSAVQIATELALRARVTLATRAPLSFIRQRPFGRDVHFWWWLLHLDTSPFEHPLGALFQRLVSRRGPAVLDTGVYQQALAANAPGQRAMFSRFTEDGVVWADGHHEQVDAVIFATGYRPSLEYLAPLGALDAQGRALQRHGLSLTVPGLGYVGLSDQRTFASATLRGVGADAAVVVCALAHQLRPAKPWFQWGIMRRCCTGTLQPGA
jgi:putative flavoprotein involved in K+ transport